jgi:hypothetical protein
MNVLFLAPNGADTGLCVLSLSVGKPTNTLVLLIPGVAFEALPSL